MEEDLRDWLMRSGRFSLRTRTNKGEKVNGALRWPVAVKPHDVSIGRRDLLSCKCAPYKVTICSEKQS